MIMINVLWKHFKVIVPFHGDTSMLLSSLSLISIRFMFLGNGVRVKKKDESPQKGLVGYLWDTTNKKSHE